MPLISREIRKHVVDHLKSMKLQNSSSSTTVAYVMHKYESDPRKVGQILWRIMQDPKIAAQELKKQFVILGGNHSFASNLAVLEIRPNDKNFLGMLCECYGFIDYWDDDQDDFLPEGKKMIDCVSQTFRCDVFVG